MTSSQTERSTIEDALDSEVEFAEAWRPKEGDKLIGTVVAITERDGGYGPYPILTIRSGESELAVHAFHTVLANELAKIAPKIGDEIGVKYLGKAKEGYHRYRAARADGETAPINWSAYAEGESSGDGPVSDVPADTDGLPPADGGEASDDDIPF